MKYVLAEWIAYLFLQLAHILELLPVLATLATWILHGVHEIAAEVRAVQ